MPRSTPCLLIAVALLAGCGEDTSSSTSTTPAPRGPSTTETPTRPRGEARPRTPAPDERPTVASFLGYTAPKPATWIWQPPTGRMRAANYAVPARTGGEHAHLVVYQGIGGSVDANIDRWTTQFRSPEGEPVEPVVSALKADGLPIVFVELTGEHRRMGTEWFTPNQMFLAAIVDTPEGPMHIRLSGHEDTVGMNRTDFLRMVQGLRATRTDGKEAPADPDPQDGS